MTRYLGRASCVVLSLVLAASAAAALPAAGAAPNRNVTTSATDQLIPEPANGRAALRALDDRLPEAARVNNMKPAQLRDLLLSDSAAWLDPAGRIYYKDPIPTGGTASAAPDVANYPLEDTFQLHSKPGSPRTIFLDFDGTDVTGTAWNNLEEVAPGFHTGWTLDGSGTSSNDTERAAIQSIFDRVAEDFAPFDVDVTTEDPGPAAIDRANEADQVFGTRVLISSGTQASGSICGNGCGGVAYLDAFDAYAADAAFPYAHYYLQPAWVFPHLLSNDTKNIAEAATHEAGHNFGLRHDDVNGGGYYAGHANWAPIMGVAYEKPIGQWSKGDYVTGTNKEDDLAIIAARGAPLRTDDAGDTVALAADELPVGPAFISTRTDKDVFLIGQCHGEITLAAEGAPFSPNLDIELSLLNSAGGVVASDNPASGTVSTDVASGMDASITHTVPNGVYYAQVDGVGNGTAATGYDDYGSLGIYTLTQPGPCTEVSTEPGAPENVTTSTPDDALSATIQWSPPEDDGGSAITGYTVSIDGTPTDLGPGATSHTFTGLAPGTTYALSAAAFNAVGTGPSAGGNATTKDYPGSVTGVTGEQLSLDEATISWSGVDSDGGSPITDFEVSIDGGGFSSAGGPSATSYTFTGLTGREHDLTVRPVNGIGNGGETTVSTAFYTAPGAVENLAASVRAADEAADVTWSPPTDDGGRPITEHKIFVDGVPLLSVPGDAEGVTIENLERGNTYAIGVRAVNAEGDGSLVTVDAAIPADKPTAPRIEEAQNGEKGGEVTAVARWRPPVTDNGAAITKYKILAAEIKGKKIVQERLMMVGADQVAHDMRLGKGKWRFAVSAMNAVGWSPWSEFSNTVKAR